MTDRLRVVILADVAVEPASGIEPARFSRQCQSPLAEPAREKRFVQIREVANLLDADGVEVALATLPIPGTFRMSRGARKPASIPGRIHSTPFGFAWSEAILDTNREVDAPIEQFRPVSSFTASWSASAAMRAGPCRRSAPVRSR